MGTRAVYFFEDRQDDDCYYGVYKHYDGYHRVRQRTLRMPRHMLGLCQDGKLMNLRRRLLRQTKTPKVVRFDCFQTLSIHQSP